MYKILFFVLMILLFIILYNILSIIFNVERKDTIKAYNSAKIKKTSSKNPKYMFEKYIKLTNYKVRYVYGKNECCALVWS